MIPLTLLLTPLPLLQGPTPPAAAGDEWFPLDGVVAMAGDGIVTRSSLYELLARAADELQIETEEDLTRALMRALEDSVTLLLETQAGQDLGLNPFEIERVIDRSLAIRRQEEGATGFLAYLEEQGSDALTVQAGQTKELYQVLFRNSAVGRPVADRRPTRDRFVRPGELLAIYRVNKDDLGQPDIVRLEILTISAAAEGGAERARERAVELRVRIVAGEEFAPLVAQYGASDRETGGLTDPLTPRNVTDRRMREFARDAAEGEVSEVLPIERPPEGIIGYRVVRLYNREDGGPPPPFEDAQIQRGLRRSFINQRDNVLLNGARARLWRSAQAGIWTDPKFVPQREAADPAAARGREPSAPEPAPAPPAEPSGARETPAGSDGD